MSGTKKTGAQSSQVKKGIQHVILDAENMCRAFKHIAKKPQKREYGYSAFASQHSAQRKTIPDRQSILFKMSNSLGYIIKYKITGSPTFGRTNIKPNDRMDDLLSG